MIKRREFLVGALSFFVLTPTIVKASMSMPVDLGLTVDDFLMAPRKIVKASGSAYEAVADQLHDLLSPTDEHLARLEAMGFKWVFDPVDPNYEPDVDRGTERTVVAVKPD